MLAFVTTSAIAAGRVNARAWRAVKTYDMTALQKIDPPPLRQLIGLRFNYRDRVLRHLKPNWFYSSVYSATGANSVPVMIATADVAAFRRLPVSPETGGDYIAYGQVLRDSEANFIFLRLLGTKVNRDGRGNATISW